MKKILLAATILLSTSMYFSCGKKDASPGYYFKFKADGVQYYYKYGCETGFVGTSCNIGAGQGKSSSFNPYFIYGYSLDNPAARGEVRFFLNKEDFDNLDTIVLDGSRNKVVIYSLNASSNNYLQRGIHLGELFITEKKDNFIRGRFYFECEQQYDGTVMSVSEGEFFIRRTN